MMMVVNNHGCGCHGRGHIDVIGRRTPLRRSISLNNGRDGTVQGTLEHLVGHRFEHFTDLVDTRVYLADRSLCMVLEILLGLRSCLRVGLSGSHGGRECGGLRVC